jgi:hypothetical protein
VRSRLAQHAAAASAHVAIVWWWLHPIIRDLSSALPGTHASDNVTFVWNLWWMRYVLHHPGLSFFSTSFLFYPVGTDLTLHTHTALPALVAALIGPASLIASQNLLIAAHLFLNFVCSYALGYRITRHAGAAFAGSFVFGASPFVGAHLPGHFNLIAAWTLPLVVLLWSEAMSRSSSIVAVACGIALSATAYVDYYLFVYAVLLVAVLTVAPRIDFLTVLPPPNPWRRRALVALAVLLATDAVVIAAILLLRRDRLDAGPIHVSIRTVSNPVTAAWLLVLFGAAIASWGRVRIAWRAGRPAWRLAVSVSLAAFAVLLPIIVRGATLWSEGQYVSQHYQWRSAPGGVDVATVAMGNPFNALWGGPVRRLYSMLNIDLVEAGTWIPIGALVLVAVAVGRCWKDPAARAWALAAAVFMVWALGPWLMVTGRQSPLVLPGILVRYIPIVANARMPGRAMVVVYLAVAQLAVIGIAALLAGGSRARVAAWSLALLLLVDCVPAPPPVFYPRIPPPYASLQGAQGALCELPLGLRDGFGEIGKFDAAIMLNQTVHERPILGGFVARLSPSVVREYGALPVVNAFLRLSSGGKLTDEPAGDPRAITAQLAAAGIVYIVVNTRTASPDLIEYVRTRISLSLIAEEDGRTFYEVSR